MNNLSCTVPVIEGEAELSNYGTSTVLSTYPTIFIKRELNHSSTVGSIPSILQNDRKILMTPRNEPLTKRLTRIYFEDGLSEALSEAEEKSVDYPIIRSCLSFARCLLKTTDEFHSIIWPRLNDRELSLIENYSQARNWSKSLIRFMRWHPKCFKLAVATSDDSVRIYTKDLANTTILKNGHQKLITSLAWRPLTASELAVGCYNGVILWKLDPSANTLRPTSQFSYIKKSSHYPITSLEWNHTGSLLATASVRDRDILIWEADTGRTIPLKRIGLPCALIKWSPNSHRIFTSTIGNVFRVWETNKWTPQRWTMPIGSIQSAAWSPCSNHLLFVTVNEPILYRLCFVEDQIYKSTAAPKQSFPIADFSRVKSGNHEIGGNPQSICWDSTGKYVAVLFKDSQSVAVFTTTIDRNSINISPSFFVSANNINEHPSYICFQEIYDDKEKVILTIGWSTGRIQYFPILC